MSEISAGTEKRISDLETENKRLCDIFTLLLEENFSGQSRLSPYAKRKADEIVQARKDTRDEEHTIEPGKPR